MFITAYVESDWFGKAIFWGLFLLSAYSWTILLYKSWTFYQVRRLADEFTGLFSEKDPLTLQSTKPHTAPHPFFEIYKAFKQKTLQIIGRNHMYSGTEPVSLSEADLNLIETAVHSSVSLQVKNLEKSVWILSTIAALGPFLGLLGTVWGILITFSSLHSKGFVGSNNAMLSGLSMALATTVIGLLIAIPALIGNNYLRNGIREYRRDMEDFSSLLLTSVELQYRKPDAQKIPVS
jgi:biopolymer transport protein TolQ